MEIFIDNIKMPSRIYYQSNKEYYSQYQRKFYHDNKETLKEQARIEYHNLSPKKKKKETNMLKIDIIISLKIKKKMKKEHMLKADIITCPVTKT